VTEAPTDEAAVSAAKRILRSDVRRRRAERPAESRRAGDATRTLRLIDRLVALRPDCVAAYLSAGTEPDTTAVVEWLAGESVRVLLPTSTDGAWSVPAWADYLGADRLRTGPRDIAESVGDRLAADAIGDADVVLCPGLAGTPAGVRLGRGGGWYDRVLPLSGAGATVILLLNDDEVMASLPSGPLDRRVDEILTPTRGMVCATAE